MQTATTSPDGQKLPPRNGRPFRHIPVRAYDEESRVFFLQTESGESRLGVAFQGSPMTGADDRTMGQLKSVLTTAAPPGSFAQYGLLSEPDITAHVKAYATHKSKATGLLKRMAERRAAFITSGVDEALPGMQDVHMCRQRIIVTFSIPCSTIPTTAQLKTIRDIAVKLKDGLSAAGLYLSQMDEPQYLALLRRFFRLYKKDDFTTNEFDPLREQVCAPGDSVEFSRDDVNFNDGEYFAKMLSVKHFPPVGNIALMNLLVGDPFGTSKQVTDPFWICATIHYPDQNKKVGEVRQKFAWITNQQFGGLAHMIPSLKYKKAGIDILMHEMDGGGGTLCELNFTVTLFSRDLERLNGAAESFRTWAASYGFDMREDKRILKALYYQFMPLGTSVNGIQNMFRFHTMAVAHAIRMLPVIGNWAGTGSGAASIMTSRRGTPVLFDPYDSTTNRNGIIVAGPGSGKSFAAQQLISDWMGGGARVWVIDQGRSFEKLCKALDGQFIEFSETSDMCLNPFTHIEDIKEEMPILKAMFAKMAAPEQGLDDFQMGVLEEKIYAAFSKRSNEADVDLVAQLCLDDKDEEIKKLGRQLFPFTHNGSNGRWFNGVNNVDFNKDFVVLELKELENDKTLQQVVLIQLFASIGQEMYHTGKSRPKALLIDEAWALLDDPVMGKAIEIAYRTVRKHEGSAWLITQNIGDVYNSPSGLAIISSAEYKIIMQQKEESIEAAIRSGQLKMDVYELQMLKSIHTVPGKYAEMMIQSADGWGVAKLIVDRFSQILFSTKGWERDLVFERMKQGENVVDVIEQFVMEGK